MRERLAAKRLRRCAVARCPGCCCRQVLVQGSLGLHNDRSLHAVRGLQAQEAQEPRRARAASTPRERPSRAKRRSPFDAEDGGTVEQPIELTSDNEKGGEGAKRRARAHKRRSTEGWLSKGDGATQRSAPEQATRKRPSRYSARKATRQLSHYFFVGEETVPVSLSGDEDDAAFDDGDDVDLRVKCIYVGNCCRRAGA